MGKATRARSRVAVQRAIGREVRRRTRELHAECVEVVAAYYELANRYERLVATVDVFWDELPPVDDALLGVHDRLGLTSVSFALEAAARRFEETGLAAFAPGSRQYAGWGAPTVAARRKGAARFGASKRGSGRADRGRA